MQAYSASASIAETAVGDVCYRPLDALSGHDHQMQDLVERGKRLIDKKIPILILGETGTGKEFLSRALHAYSVRKDAAWVAVNCASIPETLIESELFGYAKGAFSGALPGGLKGKVPQADGGTLFLDEIGDMPSLLQTRLLRVLSEKEVVPLGSASPVKVDVQLICATHQDIQSLVLQNRFREDLYYRIAGGILKLPALRERSDKKALIMQMIADEVGMQKALETEISDQALQQLLIYHWPGNLRQMHAVIRYACAVMDGHCIGIGDLPEEIMQLPAVTEFKAEEGFHMASQVNVIDISSRHHKRFLDERMRVIDALSDNRWNISAASRQLGICRASLYRKLRELEIPHVRDQGKQWHTA